MSGISTPSSSPLRLLRRAACLLAVLSVSHGGFAQEAETLEGVLPDSIVITASRYAEDVRHTGRRVAVWTASDIERLPVTSVDDLLRTVAGVDVQSRGGFGIQSDLSIRGSGFNGVLLLLDGAPINDPMTGHFLADLPVPLSEVARVEVLRGPAAAVYGPDALGGVVQLFTHAGLRSGAIQQRLRPQLSVTGGQHDLYGVDASLGGFAAGMHVSAATAWQGTDGESVAGGAARSDFRRRVHTAAVSTRRAGADVFARVGWDDREFGAFHFYTPFPSDTAREETSTLWGQVRVRGADWTAQVHAKQHFDRYVYNPATPANEHTSRTINAFADRRWHASDAMSVSVGAEGGVRGIDSNNLGVHQDASAGLFAAATWGKGALDLRGAGHADYDPAYGLEVTPQIYGALDVGTAVLHGGVARAVRAPNYIERYFNTTLESPRGRSLGNPDLQPERAWSAEAGVTWEALQDVRLHLTGFRRVTRDLIDYAMASPSDTVFLARNLHRVEARGAEAEIEARGRIGNSIVSFTSSYTLLDADLGEVSEGVSFKYALTHARHLVQSTFSVNHGRWGAGTRALYKDPIDGDAYFVAHLHAGYVVPLSRGRLTISTELRNVFDVDYADVFDAPMPGRWWMAGLRWAP